MHEFTTLNYGQGNISSLWEPAHALVSFCLHLKQMFGDRRAEREKWRKNESDKYDYIFRPAAIYRTWPPRRRQQRCCCFVDWRVSPVPVSPVRWRFLVAMCLQLVAFFQSPSDEQLILQRIHGAKWSIWKGLGQTRGDRNKITVFERRMALLYRPTIFHVTYRT